jgi:hypothetical protein
MEIWRWSASEVKVHTGVDFGRYLMQSYRPGEGRRRITWSAIYKDRTGKLWGFDFIINRSDLERVKKLYRKFGRGKSWTETGETGSDSRAEVTYSDIKQ